MFVIFALFFFNYKIFGKIVTNTLENMTANFEPR